MRLILAVVLLFSLFACQGNKDSAVYLASRSDSLSAEQKKALLPNELFEVLFDQKDEQVLQSIIDQNGHYLFDLNDNGDTALAVAIKSYNLKGALFIVRQLSPEHYLHTNFQGEGYLYLASQKGYVELIKLLADRFHESRKELLSDSDYEFSDLDMKTNSGERALHVAKNYMVAEALQYEYERGFLEYPLRKFQFLQNNKDQSFLHTAVRDQNSDLLRWGLKQNCSQKDKWKDRAFYYRYPSYIWRGVQTYGKTVSLDWDNLINAQDKEGNTAVNFGAKTMFYEGIRILSDCQWTDWLLEDNGGNIPLQSFLLALDPLKPDQSKDTKDIFILIMESRTRFTLSGIPEHINSINNQGESSLHISARLADPFFYNSLKKYGDIDQENHHGQTPRQIFELKRKQFNQAGF